MSPPCTTATSHAAARRYRSGTYPTTVAPSGEGSEAGGFVTETTWELGDDGSLRFAAQPELPWPAGATHIQLLPLERID
ncbi:hypothetical protein CPE01_02090 [Cellulomonas persica]|uniref:Uncharacterized protein n=1 Tax=Cellulomonas persica TaxID=76861 RepID=A0A510UPT4_9CELL|nr:hypothetical protein CPE01_02090 [Cellulomonas persica]